VSDTNFRDLDGLYERFPTRHLTTQELYDARETDAAISGSDLHDLFRAVCDGEPSPSGHTHISRERLRAYAAELRAGYVAHKASGGRGGEYLLDIATFAESFI
jgi:hypothetical protein